MAGIVKISEAAVLAVHTVALLGDKEQGMLTTGEIAGFLGASEAHLSKVLQRLVRSGVLSSARGPKGGFRLADGAAEMTLLDVYEAIEGPLHETGCLLAAPVCGGECIMGEALREVGRIVRKQLQAAKISQVGAGLKERFADAKKHHQN